MSAAATFRCIAEFERRREPVIHRRVLRPARMVFGKMLDGLSQEQMARLCPARWLVIEHYEHREVERVAGYRTRAEALLEFARVRGEHLAAGLPVEAVNGCLLVMHPGRAISCLRVESRATWFEWCELYGLSRWVDEEDE